MKGSNFNPFPVLLLAASLLLGGTLSAQQELRIGQHRFVPEQNVGPRVRSQAQQQLPLGEAVNGRHNVLMQFARPLGPSQRAALARQGVSLGDYLGGNAYFVTVRAGFAPGAARKARLTSVVPIRGAWKMSEALENWEIPEYAEVGTGMARVQLLHFPNVTTEWAAQELSGLGIANIEQMPRFSLLVIDLPQSKLHALADLPWVASLSLVPAPQQLYNAQGRMMGKACVLGLSGLLGGRGLTGEGVKIGVWDGNVEPHFDYAARLHQKEFEFSVGETMGHGMHVVGSLAGAGLLNPRMQGVAPGAQVYAYNFNKQSNGLNEQAEMVKALEEHGVYLSSHSYGPMLQLLCPYVGQASYNSLTNDFLIDLLANIVPTVTQVYAAGNDWGQCDRQYGTTLRRAKNVIYVGALDAEGRMARFSSWGPQDDGRVVPTVSIKGDSVRSTLPGDRYGSMSGTSMATPLVSGHIALMTERYHQLHGGRQPESALVRALIIATADDVNAPGPDYSYGYGILNADAAVTALEKEQYRRGELRQGDAPLSYRVPVPRGATRAWVALAWTDTVSSVAKPYGDPVLINDLNLTVDNGGTSYLPWVLDKEHPEADPARKEDNINNAEVVSIDNPNGELAITISPKRVTTARQGFYVVWHFDTDTPRIAYPIGGELLAPGDTLVIQAINMQSPIRAELSYDNGKSYRLLAQFKGKYRKVFLPKDAPFTAAALVRLVDAQGRVARSPHPFTIMPAPSDVRIEKVDDGSSSVLLSWKPIEGVKEYEVLYTTASKAQYASIGKTQSYKYLVPKKYLGEKERYAFCVRAISESGVVSQRSVAEVSAAVAQNNSRSVRVPFVEEFRVVPSPDVFLEKGDCMVATYEETPANLGPTPGAHTLMVERIVGIADDTWDDSHPFDTKKSYARIGLRHLDLSKESGKVFIEASGVLTCGEGEVVPQLRLEVDGKPIKAVDGGEAYVGMNDRQSWVWELTDYKAKPIEVALRTVSKNTKMGLILLYVKVMRESQKPDLELMNFAGINLVGAFTESTEVNSYVRNNSSLAIPSAPIYAFANGRPVGSVLVKDMKPFEIRKVSYALDLSTDRPEGELLKVEVRVDAEGDSNEENNVKRGRLYNVGKKYPMKRGAVSDGHYYGKTDELVVKGSRVITDDGGCGLGYVGKHDDILLLKPSDPDKVLAITVQRASLQGEGDELYINTPMRTSSQTMNRTRNLAVIQGELEHPITVLSTADDGGIVLGFRTSSRSRGKGWELLAAEVDRSNTLTLEKVSITPIADSEKMAVKAMVKNVSGERQTDVSITIAQGLEPHLVDLVATEFIRSVAPGESVEHTFEYQPTVLKPSYDSLRVYIDGYDADFSDNMSRHLVLNDYYCAAPPVEAGGEQVVRATLFDRSAAVGRHVDRVSINAHDTLVAYRDSKRNTLQVMLSGATDGLALGVWVDWNDDKQFGDAASGEFFAADVKAGDASAAVTLAVPTNATGGVKRMRVLLAEKASLAACGAAVLPHSDGCDFMLRLEGADFPSAGDVSLTNLSANRVGAPLSAEEEVKVEIANPSDATIESLQVGYSVDGGVPVVETVSCHMQPFVGKSEYTFNARADLSAHGKHAVTAWIASDNTNLSNDTLSLSAHSVTQNAGGEDYYLHFGGDARRDEMMTFSDLASERSGSSFCFDFMLRLDRAQFAPICQAANFVMLACAEGSGFPENSVLFAYAGAKTVYLSPGGTLRPGTWQHIAVDQTLADPVRPRLFVDGKMISLVTTGDEGRSSMQNFKAMYLLEGSVDNLRFWKDYIDIDIAKRIAYTETSMLPKFIQENLIADFQMNEGPTNTALSAGKHYAVVESERTGVGENSIWQSRRDIISGIHFENQVGQLDTLSRKVYRVTLAAGTDLSKVLGTARSNFATGRVLYDGMEVKANIPFDFTSGAVTLYGLVVDYYGKNLFDTVTITAVKEPSDACRLLALKASTVDNPGLTDAINLDPVPSTIAMEVPETYSGENFTFTFTLSEGATAYANGVAIGSPAKVNLAEPILLRVLAANGRTDSFYTLALAKKSSAIKLAVGREQIFYGDSLVGLPEAEGSGRAVLFSSDSPNVITYTGRSFRAVGVGKATLVARLPGGKQYGAAEEVRHVVEVLPRPATIAPLNKVLAYGALPGKIELAYAGLLPNDDTLLTPTPSYIIEKNGAAWTPADGPLAVGEYTVRPESNGSYRAENYMVTPLPGKLTVCASSAVAITLTVSDDASHPVEGAAIRIDGTLRGVSSTNPLGVEVLPGRYVCTVSKEGYAEVTDTIEVTDAPVVKAFVLPVRDIELAYLVNGNGRLEGYEKQVVARGEDGAPVTAIPDAGYVFDGWDDGERRASRIERNVRHPMQATARFRRLVHSVNYTATIGGGIAGDAAQQVSHLENGTRVTATPEAGCEFVEWSDGMATPARTDEKVSRDAVYSAIFTKKVNLPYVQHFETPNELPAFMYRRDDSRRSAAWYVTNETVRGSKLDDRFLTVKSPANGSDDFGVEVITPKFDLTNVTGGIAVEFDYIFIGVMRTQVEVRYCIDGGRPVILANLDKDLRGEKQHFSGQISESLLAGKALIQLSFRYRGPSHEVVCIDNLIIKPSNVAGKVELNYFASKGGHVNGATHVTTTTTVGAEGEEVTAEPEAGWAFACWSDGVKEKVRKDSQATTVEALFIQSNSGASFYSISYSADGNGAIAGVRTQKGLKTGERGLPVTAVPNRDGFHFVGWSDGRTDNPRTDMVDAKDIHVEAKFSSRCVLLYRVDPAAGGEIEGEATQEVEPGADAKAVTAKATPGYHFVAWSDGLRVPERIDAKVQKSATFTAHFAQEYTLEYVTSNGGTIEGNALQRVQPGGMGSTVIAKPFVGYKFDAWSDGLKAESRTDKGDKELQVAAKFLPVMVSISYTAATGGSLKGAEARQSVPYGSNSAPVLAVPSEGFHFVGWSDGRKDNPRYERSVTASVEVEAIFSESFSFTYSALAGGKLEGEAKQVVARGADALPVAAVPEANYHFVGWSDGLKDNPRTDREASRDITVLARFSNRYTITYLAADGGAIEGTALQSVEAGSDAAPVEAKPLPGYEFKGWSDGDDHGARQDKAVRADATYTARFVPKKFTLTVEVTNGKYNPDPRATLPKELAFTFAEAEQKTYEVAFGALSQPVNLRLAPGVQFDQWEDGSKELPRFFTLDGDRTVKASVEKKMVDLYIERNGVSVEACNISNPFGGKLFGEHEVVELGQIIGVNHLPSRVPQGEQFFVETEGIRLTAFKFPAFPHARFYQVIDGSKPARLSISIRRPRFSVVYKATEGGLLLGSTKQEVSVGSSSTPVEAIALPGYYFKGWSDGNSQRRRIDLITNAPVEATALFERVSYSIVFGANGGSGSMEPQSMLYGESKAIALNTFTKPNSTFKGWAFTPDAAEPAFSDGQEVKNLSLDNGAKLYLYALWELLQYEVKFGVAAGSEAGGTLIASAGGGPVVSGAKLSAGTQVLFEAKPNDGYEVDAWRGPVVGSGSSVTITLQSDVEISVAFKERPVQDAVESQQISEVEALPNPFTAFVTISNAYNVVRVSILTVDGSIVKSVAHSGAEHLQVKTEDLPAGIYFCRCDDVDGASRTLKLIKQ